MSSALVRSFDDASLATTKWKSYAVLSRDSNEPAATTLAAS